ncbi:hypothetical protein B0H10DRAFT_2217655 [Mycena sp. CBHHK59/15]|nr:hypothetical protein B0H10DRAFT_2217655 [Mycena sp. CBHHK59/15]
MRVDFCYDIHARPILSSTTNSRPPAQSAELITFHPVPLLSTPLLSGIGIRIPPSAAAIALPESFWGGRPAGGEAEWVVYARCVEHGARVAVPATAEANHHYNHHAPTLHIQLRPTYRPDPWPAALPAAFHARCTYRAGSESIPDLPSQLDASVRDFPSPSSPAHSGSGHSSGRASTTSAGSTTRQQMCSARMADERRGVGVDTAR